MKKLIALIAVAMTSAFIANAACVDKCMPCCDERDPCVSCDAPCNCQDNWYVGVGVNYPDLLKDTDDSLTCDKHWFNKHGVKENKIGYQGYAGYRFCREWAMEAGYNYLGDIELFAASATTVKVKNQQAYLAALYIAPLWEGIELFAKAGVAWFKSTITETSDVAAVGNVINGKLATDTTKSISTKAFGLNYGIGAQWVCDMDFGVRLEYSGIKHANKWEGRVYIPNHFCLSVTYCFAPCK